MMTVKQVSTLTGVSVRTLQFYDEIGLLKPTQSTNAGYRLYDNHALERLQQILFFKELDFTLKEVKVILEDPDFDQEAAFRKQRELIALKRDRLNSLLKLLDKLIKGEKYMEFKAFDMSEYFQALEDFKKTHGENIVERLGSLEAFDEMLAELREKEAEITDLAVKQYGSLDNFTEAMKKNLQEFLTNGPSISKTEVEGLMEKTEAIVKRLTADLSKEVTSKEIQKTVGKWIDFVNECSSGVEMGENYWAFMAEQYMSNPVFVDANDKKYGEGASKFMGLAVKAYIEKQR